MCRARSIATSNCKDQEGAQVPTASRLNEDNPAYDTALAELATLGSDIDRENELRDKIARLSKSPRLRPVSYYGNTRGFYLFLMEKKRTGISSG